MPDLRSRYRALCAAASICSLAAVVAACGSPSATGSADAAAGCKQVLIGSQEPDSGSYAADGLYFQKGFELAVATVNNQGGFKVGGTCYKFQSITADNQSQPTLAASTSQKFAADGIKFIFGPYSSALFEPAFQQVAGTDTIVFDTAAATATLQKSSGGQYLFTPFPATATADTDMVNAVVARYKPKKAAIFVSNDDAGTLQYKGELAALQKAGVDVVYTKLYDPTTQDFSSYISAMRADGVDAVFGPYLDSWFKPFLQQAAVAGWTTPVFAGGDGVTLGSLNSQIQHFEFLPVTLPVADPSFKVSNAVAFRSAYAKMFGSAPPNNTGGDYTIAYYDSVLMLAKAMSVAGTVSDIPKIASTMETSAVTSYSGRIQGLSYDSQRHAHLPVYIGFSDKGKVTYETEAG